MTHERRNKLLPPVRKPYEVFGLSDKEAAWWRLTDIRFREIIFSPATIIHRISASSNNQGDFLFVTTSRLVPQGRVGMTFFGMGYQESSKRWITEEWHWYQTSIQPHMVSERVSKDEAERLLMQRKEVISLSRMEDPQQQQGKAHERLADLSVEDSELVEMGGIVSLDDWLAEVDQQTPPEEPPPTGEYLLDRESREKLPKLYENEELGMEAKALVKFFTPDAQWSWYASEFDGDDILFGLVSGLEVELGYFSLKELQEVKGPLGLHIERDLHFKPKTLQELKDMHVHKLD
jgi:hypothetical protein